MNPAPTHGQRAIVIGGSLAGMLTARVLSDHFEQVTIIERDKINDLPESRKGQPQTRHVHALLANGLAVMTRLFPDLPDGLRAGGAIFADMAAATRWYVCGGYRLQFDSGLIACLVSRPFLEWQIRRRVVALPNVTVLDECDVQALLSGAENSRLTGVRVSYGAENGRETELAADLVIDATGRASATPKRLEALGYSRVEESTVAIGMGYRTRLYRRRSGDLQGAECIMIAPEPPRNKRSGFFFPVEDDRWILTLAGHAGDHAPTDEAGFLEFARSLAASDIYNTIRTLEPLTDILTHGFPSNLRHHYERLTRFPEGYLVVGDAICSFNPIYGQGMTSAAMQAAALGELLNRGQSLDELWKPFFKQAARIVDIPWMTAVGEDFRFPETQGPRGRGTNLINAYMTKVQLATHRDPVVYGAFLRVMNLLKPPTSLFRPHIVWRVLRNGKKVAATS